MCSAAETPCKGLGVPQQGCSDRDALHTGKEPRQRISMGAGCPGRMPSPIVRMSWCPHRDALAGMPLSLGRNVLIPQWSSHPGCSSVPVRVPRQCHRRGGAVPVEVPGGGRDVLDSRQGCGLGCARTPAKTPSADVPILGRRCSGKDTPWIRRGRPAPHPASRASPPSGTGGDPALTEQSEAADGAAGQLRGVEDAVPAVGVGRRQRSGPTGATGREPTARAETRQVAHPARGTPQLQRPPAAGQQDEE